jgi:signal peptidase II
VPELQAARGASLITSEDSVPSEASPGGPADALSGRPGARATRLAFSVAAAGLLLDQVTKQLAVRELSGRAPVEVVGELLQLRLVRNPGAAFSAGASLTPYITVVAIVATLVAGYYAFRVRHRGWALALGLLLAGVTGNLLDRLFRAPSPFRGHVVDFFALPHWPVFNVADICIDIGGVMMVVLLLRGTRLDGTRPDHTDRDDDTGKDQP